MSPTPRSTRPRRLAAAAMVVALAAVPATALAATRNGITPTTPKAGARVPEGKSVTFKGRVRGAGPVFVHVCKSAKRSQKEGTICTRAAIGEARKRGGRFTYVQKVFAFDEYWLNTPGTYYWQAHRIACEDGDTRDCRQEGPVVRFRVR